MKRPKFSVFFILGIVLFWLVGCVGGADEALDKPTINFGYQIDKTFAPLVNALGELKSPAITAMFSKNGVYYQYTLSYMLAYNPNAPVGQQYRLLPLGHNLNVRQPPITAVTTSDLVVDGYVVWYELVGLYKMYGTLIGPPLTELLYNTKANRYEQYFTNMAFYQDADDLDGDIGLLPYGAWYCQDYCPDAYAAIEKIFDNAPPNVTEFVTPDPMARAEINFAALSKKLEYDFTGAALDKPFQNQEGQFIQIFENLVMIIDPRFPGDVEFLNLPAEMGIQPDDPEPPSDNPNMVFYPVRSGLGYNVPRDIFDFISINGRDKVAGQPIQHLYQLANGGWGQCFETFCVEYHPTNRLSDRVKMVQLGAEYLRRLRGLIPELAATQQAAPAALIVKVWEQKPLLPPGNQQEIGVAIFRNNQPVSNAAFTVSLLLPDGNTYMNYMPKTGFDGKSRVILEPLNYPVGTVIPYQVCLNQVGDLQACFHGSFLIWDD